MHFSPFPDTVYEWVEWMWRMSERSGCGEYLKRIFICVSPKNYPYVFLFCMDDNVEI